MLASIRFFFFQADDGIRDHCVTGVQTCSLPIYPNGACPKCNFELHCCKQCRFFDSSAQFECMQPIQERISPKDAKNNCSLYEFRMTVEKDTAPTSYAQKSPANGNAAPPRHSDARQAFENLFKK